MRYLLVDGNHLTGRAAAVATGLTTSDGRTKTGVFHMFFRSLSYTKHELRIPTEQIIVCWDGGRSAFRMKLYPEYKAGRKSTATNLTPEEEYERQQYRNQLHALHEVLPSLGISQIRVKQVEADDLLGFVSFELRRDGHKVVVYSGDRDSHQLVIGSEVEVFDPRLSLLDEEAILKYWQLKSLRELLFYRALTGDHSDNIAGVSGIGDVRARLVCEHIDKFWTDEVPADEKTQKWFAKAKAASDVIVRNLQLMRLPRSLGELDHLYPDEAVQIALQVCKVRQNHPERDISRFVDFCQQYELTETLENLSKW